MKAVFDAVGECKSCLCLSNLGRVELPEVMTPYVTRMDFIIGVQARAPHNCGVITWNGTAYINCIRNIRGAGAGAGVFTACCTALACRSRWRATPVERKRGDDMYCIKCGVELADSEKICPLCGTRVFHPDLPCGNGEPPYPPAEHSQRGGQPGGEQCSW